MMELKAPKQMILNPYFWCSNHVYVTVLSKTSSQAAKQLATPHQEKHFHRMLIDGEYSKWISNV